MDQPAPFAVSLRGGPYAFVSYARADAARVYPIIGHLHRKGYDLWYDGGIEPTEEWAETIPRRIDESHLVIVFASTVAYSRGGVRKEVDWAVKHDASILVVQLDAELAVGLDFLSGDEQRMLAWPKTHEALLEELGTSLQEHGVVATARAHVADPSPPEPRSRIGMPGRQHARPQQSMTDTFADRVPESEALRTSVEHQLARLRGDVEILDEVFPHVLVFHGQGGRGKTGLSRRMERWITGGLEEKSDWGPWPHPGMVPVRWDFHDAEGVFPIRDLLLTLRRSLTPVHHSWTAFDLALAAYLEVVRGSAGDLGVSGVVADHMLLSLQRVAGELRVGVPHSLDATSVRRLLHELDIAQRRLPMFDDFDGLGRLLDDISRIAQGGQGEDVAEDLLYLLTQEVFYIPASQRPAVVVFVDPFEKIERHINHGLEARIAAFIEQLPYALFVITGRNRLGWAEPHRSDLSHAGPASWPGLIDGASEDPRQHLLGKLSDEDVRRVYDRTRAEARWDLPDEVVDELVARANGLPLHIDAALALLHNLERTHPGRTHTIDDLGGELPQVVVQLLEVLSPEEADAFRAMCVLPSFDPDLTTAVSGVTGGAVERAVRYALVEDNHDGSVYPFRVHDEIRRLVRLDRRSTGYWSERDWREAAERGLAEAVGRVRAGHAEGSDAAQIEGTALALRIAYEWDLYIPGLVRLVNDGPSISALARLLPEPDPARVTDSAALLAYVHAIAAPFPEAPAMLMSIPRAHPEVSAQVDLWTGYRLRSKARFDEAIEVMARAVETYPDLAARHHHQYAITLQQARRFRDALAYEGEHRPDLVDRLQRIVDRLHGIPSDNKADLAYAEKQTSRRFRQELRVAEMVNRARSHGVEREEVMATLQRTIDSGQRTDHRQCLLVLGYLSLRRSGELESIIHRISMLQASLGSTGPAIPQLLALRALSTGDPVDAAKAHDAVRGGARGAAWIPVEMWLEELGHPLAEPATQWLHPQEQVRANWLAIAEGIIARAEE